MKDIILVYYVNIGNRSLWKAKELLAEFVEKACLKETTNIVIPVRDQDSRVECINPKLLNEEQYKEVEQLLVRADVAMSMLEEWNAKMDKPTPPLSPIVKEGTIGTCPTCRSTEVKRFVFFGKSIGCIQPECEKFYKK